MHPIRKAPAFFLGMVLWGAIFVFQDVFHEARTMLGGGILGQAAQRGGVRRETLVSLEEGKYVPSLKLAYDMAQVFGEPIEEM